MKLPTYWEADSIGEFDGIVWFRKNIIIPQSWIDKELVLELGPVDDMDRTFVNGVRVGGMEQVGYWSTPRIYTIAKEIVKDSSLTIAVRVLDNGGGGGIWGNGVKMKIHPKDSDESISLAGDWKYLPVAEYISNKFYVYKIEGEEFYSRPKIPIGISENTPTMLYNGMIAPLIPYGIKGAIWYQGESNSGKPDNYYELLPLLIKNWREDWGEGNFPFYYVQIAPFIYDPNTRSQVIRDAQFKTLTVPNTGMAVTLDIGEVNNIHPADKQDVGKRLALWALAKSYNKKLVYSGPIYKSMKIRKNKIVLSFDQTGKGLVL
jgi:sialate O-acetylesterase